MVLVLPSLTPIKDSKSTSSYQYRILVFLTSILNHFLLCTIIAPIYIVKLTAMLPVALLVFVFIASLDIHFLILILTSAC